MTATTAMQRTMSVYSNQFPAIREAVSSAADKPQQQPDTNIISSGSSNSNSSGDHLDTVVLSVMGASLAAMWDAVGEEGMRPFVVSGEHGVCVCWPAACRPHSVVSAAMLAYEHFNMHKGQRCAL